MTKNKENNAALNQIYDATEIINGSQIHSKHEYIAHSSVIGETRSQLISSLGTELETSKNALIYSTETEVHSFNFKDDTLNNIRYEAK